MQTALIFSTVIAWGLALCSLLDVLRGPGLFRRIKRAVATVLWAGLGFLLGLLLILLHVFQAFSSETMVAEVTTRRLSPQQFELTYAPISLPRRSAATTVLAGDQWSISGGMVKWHPVLTGLGLKSYHKPMRVEGRFADSKQQSLHYPTVYALTPSVDWLWELLYRFCRILPFVEAVYGSSAYAYVEPDTFFMVYVTPTGYLIKRHPVQHEFN